MIVRLVFGMALVGCLLIGGLAFSDYGRRLDHPSRAEAAVFAHPVDSPRSPMLAVGPVEPRDRSYTCPFFGPCYGPGELRPIVRAALSYPDDCRGDATVEVVATIAQNGAVSKVGVIHATNECFAREVVEKLSRWRFNPVPATDAFRTYERTFGFEDRR